MITACLSAIAGALISAFAACIPGLHVYNIMALIVIILHTTHTTLPPEILIPCASGMMAGFAMLNTIPSILLSAPDESAIFTVLPGQKYLMQGHGYEGIMITAAGGLAGLFVLIFIVGPLAPVILPAAQYVLRPHTHWILWCVICFMLMSEWHQEGRLGQGGWSKFLRSWKAPGMGILTFALSGVLGFILLYKSPLDEKNAFQNLMPAFIGLFTLPWLIINTVSRAKIPPQEITAGIYKSAVFKGAVAGSIGGGFAAFFPVITGGIGGFLAGHATAIRDNRAFLASQGTSKLIYYAGGLLFFFVPGLQTTHGGAAWMMRGLYTPSTNYDYHLALAAIAISGCTAFLLVSPLARLTITIIKKCGFRTISAAALALATVIVYIITGYMGLIIMLTSTGIGLIPVLFGSRRLHCLGIILLPMACNMSGLGPSIAKLMGLL